MKKLEHAAEIIKKITDLKQLKEHGFVFKRKNSSCGGFWLHPKKKVVIKDSLIMGEKPENSVPTLQVGHKKYGYVLVQPLCKPFPRSNRNFEIIREMERESDDCHEDNVMLYRRKLVHVDW